MGSRGTQEIDDATTVESTPQDVAALYSWANLRGAKYRDYSASRREYRAQARYRAAQELLERELKAQAEAEAAAVAAEREAFAAEAVARSRDDRDGKTARAAFMKSAEEAAKRAAGQRVEAARRAQAAARASMLAMRAEREIAEARVSAEEQAKIYAEAERLRRRRAGPQPRVPLGAPAGFATFPAPVAEEGEVQEADEVVELRSRGEPEKTPPHLVFDLTPEEPARNGADEHALRGLELDASAETTEARGPAWLFPSQIELPIPPVQPVRSETVREPDPVRTAHLAAEQAPARWPGLKDGLEDSSGESARDRGSER